MKKDAPLRGHEDAFAARVVGQRERHPDHAFQIIALPVKRRLVFEPVAVGVPQEPDFSVVSAGNECAVGTVAEAVDVREFDGQRAHGESRHEHLHGRRIFHRHERRRAGDRLQPAVFRDEVTLDLRAVGVAQRAVEDEHLRDVAIERTRRRDGVRAVRVKPRADHELVDFHGRRRAIPAALQRTIDEKPHTIRAWLADESENVEGAEVELRREQISLAGKARTFRVQHAERRRGLATEIEIEAGLVIVVRELRARKERAKKARIRARCSDHEDRRAWQIRADIRAEPVVLSIETHERAAGRLLPNRHRVARALRDVMPGTRAIEPHIERATGWRELARIPRGGLARGIEPEQHAVFDRELFIRPRLDGEYGRCEDEKGRGDEGGFHGVVRHSRVFRGAHASRDSGLSGVPAARAMIVFPALDVGKKFVLAGRQNQRPG